MNFNNHSNLEGQHAFLGASKYHWINYGEDKVAEAYRNFLATQKGTVLSKDVAYHSKESDSKSIFTSITSCTEMMAGFYSVIFQNFMTTSFTRLRNENY